MDFLQEMNLPQYREKLQEYGYTDLNSLQKIETKDLVEMKIPAGHQIKFMKRIKNIKPSDATDRKQELKANTLLNKKSNKSF